jgi:hypothetical protein
MNQCRSVVRVGWQCRNYTVQIGARLLHRLNSVCVIASGFSVDELIQNARVITQRKSATSRRVVLIAGKDLHRCAGLACAGAIAGFDGGRRAASGSTRSLSRCPSCLGRPLRHHQFLRSLRHLGQYRNRVPSRRTPRPVTIKQAHAWQVTSLSVV